MLKKLFEKIWNEPAYFSLLSVLGCISLCFIYRPVYMMSDDAYVMRAAAEGTINPDFGPSEYLLYMSTLYGKVLKFLYTNFSGVYWYDILFYLFMCIAVYVITYSLIIKGDEKKTKYKLAVLGIMIAVPGQVFIAPQFTVVSGMLAVSAVCVFFMLLQVSFERRYYWGWAAYFVASLLISSLVRFEATFVVGLFCGLFMLPLLSKKEFRRGIYFSFLVFAALLLIVLCRWWDNKLIEQNPAWKFAHDFNQARVEIHDNTPYMDNLVKPWKVIEEKLNTDKVEGAVWNKVYYRFLLTWNFIGYEKVFNVENMQKVSEALKDSVSIGKNKKAGFRVSAYRHELLYFSLTALFLLLAFFNKRNLKYTAYISAVFVVLIVLMNIKFRDIPYRLWYNFALAYLVSLLMFFKKNDAGDFWLKNVSKLLSLAVGFLLIAVSVYNAFKMVENQAEYNSKVYAGYKDFRREAKKIDPKNVYLLDIYSLEHTAIPFKPNVFFDKKFKTIRLYGTIPLEQDRKLLEKYGISKDKTWEDICNREDVQYFFFDTGAYYDFYYLSWKYVLTYYMKSVYNKDIAFVKKKGNKIKRIQCTSLSKDEQKLKDKLAEIQRIDIPDYWQDILRKKYVNDFIKNDKNGGAIKSLDKVFNSLWDKKDEL